jgi:hypothetical protein
MNNAQLSAEVQDKVDQFEFRLSTIKDQDTLYDSFRELIKDIPNNYDLGTVVRQLFSTL